MVNALYISILVISFQISGFSSLKNKHRSESSTDTHEEISFEQEDRQRKGSQETEKKTNHGSESQEEIESEKDYSL